jgi:CubicO group peptidase (beta-lactamase class C family)
MTTLVAELGDIQERLDALARQHRVPGAVLAVSTSEEALEFATGVISASTGVETTTGTVFQIGSNTKLLTTTLVMQLADAGEVELDAPVQRYLPAFELAEPGAGEITIRHLLTHTSGIQGDHFADYGRGDDAVERYVGSLKEIGLIHRPGQMWSYCNSGFVLAGHVVEQMTGQPYHQLLAERICAPLGLRDTTVLAEEMLAGRCAVGHVAGPDGTPQVPPVVIMAMAQSPAGSRTVATAAELAAFARMHLAGGTARDGTRLLSEAGVRAMQETQGSRPRASDAALTQGLGWLLSDWSGARVIGHGGGTIGQLSFLEAVPEHDLVVVLLTNSDTGGSLWRDLGRWLFQVLAGVRTPRVPRPAEPRPGLPLENYAGTYERLGVRHDVAVEDGQLVVRGELSGPLAELSADPSVPPLRLRPVDSEAFFTVGESGEALVSFAGFSDGRPGYIHIGGRAARRAGSSPGEGA